MIPNIYQATTNVQEIDGTQVPANVHRKATDAIKDHVHPWIQAGSSQPQWGFKWWAALPMSILGFEDRDAVKAAGADSYRELVFLEAELRHRIVAVVEDCRRRDPVKGYKTALKRMRAELVEVLVAYRALPSEAKADALDTLLA